LPLSSQILPSIELNDVIIFKVSQEKKQHTFVWLVHVRSQKNGKRNDQKHLRHVSKDPRCRERHVSKEVSW
jgi:hypothetical protein